MNDTVNNKIHSKEEWEVFESCNRTLVVTKTQRRLVASCMNKNDAIAICDAHNRLEAKYEANQINDCSNCCYILADLARLDELIERDKYYEKQR